MKERTIFKSYLFLTKEEENDMRKYAVECLNEDREEDEKLDIDDYEVSERVYDDLSMFYEDEQNNLNKLLPNNIIALGEVGVWTGQHRGGKVLGNNLNAILYSGNCDDISVTYDRYNVHSQLAHHDGSHYMTYRMVKEGYDAHDLLDKYVYEGKDIMRYTTSLVPYIKKIYGI
jgi:hypothetical protein